jgi:hypothetical protein
MTQYLLYYNILRYSIISADFPVTITPPDDLLAFDLSIQNLFPSQIIRSDDLLQSKHQTFILRPAMPGEDFLFHIFL